jgi:hypothetical protein
VPVLEWFLFLYFKYWYFRSLKRFWDCVFNFVNVLELHQSMINDINKRVFIWRFTLFYHLFFDLRLPITPFMSDFEVPLFLSTGISFAIFHGSKNQPVCSNLLYNSERRYLRTVAEAFKYCIYKNADGNTGLDVCPIVRYQWKLTSDK